MSSMRRVPFSGFDCWLGQQAGDTLGNAVTVPYRSWGIVVLCSVWCFRAARPEIQPSDSEDHLYNDSN